MRKFFIKLFYLSLLPLVLVFIVFIISYLIPDNEILNNDLEYKIKLLPIQKNEINIIIAGDSRGERQLIPNVIKNITGFNTINIASASCDLLTTATAIKKNYPSDLKTIYVISASSWQINDGAVKSGYMSLKCFHDLSWYQKLWLYRRDLSEFSLIQNQLIRTYLSSSHKTKLDTIFNRELGYFGVDSTLNTQLGMSDILNKHAWYKNIQNNGARWALFKKTLNEIGKLNSIFIIYQPPVSHFWKVNTLNTEIDVAEKEYSAKVKLETRQYKNIVFLDFYNNDISELKDSLYYDIQHLNRKGSEVFSNYISKKIMEIYSSYSLVNDSIVRK